MMNNAFFQNRLTGKELSWGMRYLLFQTVFLPSLLSLLNGLLPIPMSAVWLNFLFFSINLGAVLWIFRRFLKQCLSVSGAQLIRIFAVGAVFFAVNQGCSLVLGKLFSSVLEDFANINDQSISAMCRENFPIMALCTVFFAPITEECFFRGVLFRGVYDRAPWAAWVVSVVLFSLVHIMNYIGTFPPLPLFLCFLQYIPAGICLAAAYRISGSFLCPVLIHAAVNAIGMLSMR